MKTPTSTYRGYRYPTEIFSDAVWIYHRFALSFCDSEDILIESVMIFVTKPIMNGV